MNNLQGLVAGIEFFNDMAPQHLQAIAECAREEQVAAGEFLGRAGEPADHFWVVREGTLVVELFVPGRGAVTIETATRGEVVGFSWLLPPHQMQFDVRALTDTRALAFDGVRLREECARDTALGYDLLARFARLMADRIHAASLQVIDVFGEHPIESQ